GALVRQHAPSTLWLTTALFEQMALHQGEALARVSQLLAGGDVLPAQRVREHLARLPPDAVLVNGYGPTENTTFSTTHTLRPRSAVGHSVPIGRPLSQSTAYVLDASLRPAPVGVPGELYVGGDGLAWGYLGQPELTAERFIPDGFSDTPGARLYRSGDVARWQADGTLEFLGRADFQVKLRGFRIEPGEVEAVLRLQPGVREALVLAREDSPGDKRLVAYVVGEPEVSGDVLREALAARLPEYMVPSAFVLLESFPLTANGKVDRKALPAPDATSSAAEYVAPRTPTEEQLAALWAEVLRLPRVGVRDNFFEAGGHSLLATQLVSRIRASFGVELPLRAVFEASTLEALARRLEVAAPRDSAPPLVAVPRTTPPPLSFAQQRLWLLDQLAPGGSAYNIPFALRMSGRLDLEALRQSFEALVHRHESLRTTFRKDASGPVQVIAPPAALPMDVVDLSHLPEDTRLAEVRRLAASEALRPFDLANGPLLRASLLRLESEHHVLLMTMHHIVSDGWSMGVLVRELVSAYEAFASGRTPQLAPLPIQYADFASWQRGWLQGDVLQEQLDYWKQQLSGVPALLELPTDRPRPAVQSPRGGALPVHLPVHLSEALSAFCQREGVTPFMALLAVWQVLLARYSGQDDVTVGSPIAGRTRAETEGLIGFFINTLVLRARVVPRATFRELLAQVRSTTLSAYEHQHLPFEKLVEELQPARSLSHSPLFQVMLVLQNAPTSALSVSGLSFLPLESEAEAAKFDLTLSMTQTPRSLSGALRYRTDLFDASTVSRLVEHLQTLLEAALASPGTRVGELPLLSPSERQQVLARWNDTHRQLPWEGAFHERFESQASLTPDALAVLDDSSQLSFAQLNRRANQLASWLRQRGTGPEVRVALCMERGADMVVAVLAILKAGGAYVPMDAAYPRERLAFMLQDCGARLVLTQRHLASRLDGSDVEAVFLDDAGMSLELARESEANPPHVTSPQHLAYVIYTSGSTGKPKGVMVQHASVMNLRAALASAVYSGVEGALRVSLNAPLSFDASVKQLIQVAEGHALCVVPQAAREDVALLKSWVEKYGVDALDCSPSHLRLLLEEGLGSSRPLRVLVGGEAVDEALWAKLSAHPFIRCFNVYGPTECTVDTTARAVHGATGQPTLGGPLANVQVYVLDERMQPVPTGVPGELFIGGAGVARGYLHRPELTAEKFIPDPFGMFAGGRLYRTGDKVRWLANGELDYLGRIDFQVKLRGFRIELGEIETALEEVAGVRRAVVLAREDVPGNQRLVAYVVGGAEAAEGVLREALAARLPGYMVPSAFVALEAMPLTSNGKVDRRALPAPESSASASEYVAPRTPSEEILASLWAGLLRVEKVSAEDDFFALGGHSLLATQVVSHVRSSLGVELPLRALFEAPTLAGLARRVEQATRNSALPELSAAPVGPR
ncbi:non-ribosomal peptide synthetase, partial [Pyxidicoccus caerfyrddinensis]|uniref:non-ribosomal peptide synthetase n=1 Tax=Pyxidicoccus caerfyrddinensis TaxID=2709663 RepID=UPI0013D949BD